MGFLSSCMLSLGPSGPALLRALLWNHKHTGGAFSVELIVIIVHGSKAGSCCDLCGGLLGHHASGVPETALLQACPMPL